MNRIVTPLLLAWWWILALSKTRLDLELTSLKGCIIGRILYSRNVVKVSLFVVPSIMLISSTPLDDIDWDIFTIDPKLETDWCYSTKSVSNFLIPSRWQSEPVSSTHTIILGSMYYISSANSALSLSEVIISIQHAVTSSLWTPAFGKHGKWFTS